MKLDLGTPAGRELARVEIGNRVTAVFKGVPVQKAYVTAIRKRAEKALNRLLYEIGLPAVGTEIYKPVGKKAG